MAPIRTAAAVPLTLFFLFSVRPASAEFSNADINSFLQAVNTARAVWGVTQTVAWDLALARTAQSWANVLGRNGQLEYQPNLTALDPRFGFVGQTLAMGMGIPGFNLNSALQMWLDGGKNWDGRSAPADANFSQVIWKTTTLVGCGVANMLPSGLIYVCDWGPGGNIDGNSPLVGGVLPPPESPPPSSSPAP